MPSLYLTPASISSLSQVLLGGLITSYLLWILRYDDRRWPTPGSRLLLGFFSAVTLFTALVFLDASLSPSDSLPISSMLNPLLGLCLSLLIQFAYHYPALPQTQIWEARVALGLSGAYTVYEAGYALMRLILLGAGEVIYRPAPADLAMVSMAIWAVVVFARRRDALARRFAAILLILVGMTLLDLLYSFNMIADVPYYFSLTTGILVCMFLFAMTYLHARATRTSFIVKLAGGLLTGLLVILGSLAWTVGPAYANQAQVALPERQALRFTPNRQGGYDVEAAGWDWDAEPGDRVDLMEGGAPSPQPFTFPFFGATATTIWVDDNCTLGVGAPVVYANLERNYGNRPAILPLFSNYRPSADPSAGIFIKRRVDALTITCQALPLYYRPAATVTMQAVLYRDGVFELRYRDLPEAPHGLEKRPQATLWFIGVSPGSGAGAPRPADLQRLPVSSDGRGLVYDLYLAERTAIHQLMLPIAIVVQLAGLGLSVGLPLIMRRTVLRPLNRLLEGVRHAGNHEAYQPIPIQDHDEIGSLTATFNRITLELDTLIHSLEAQVRARTADLSAANERLRMFSTAITQSPASFVITDALGQIEYVNPAFTRVTGYTLDEVRNQTFRLLKSGLVPDAAYQELWATINAGQVWRGELINRHKDGHHFWEWSVIAPIFNAEQQITHFVAVKEEITARKLVEQSLIESEQRYRDLFNLGADALFIIRNSDGQILEANQPAITLYGYTYEELCSLRNIDLSAEPEATQKATDSNRSSDEVIVVPLRWHRKQDGTIFPVEITARFITWKGIPAHLAAIRDSSERYSTQLALERLATSDPLTGLFNRRYFFERADQLFAGAGHPHFVVSALMIDIDHFKRFNDTYGHPVGDEVLIQVAHRLQEQIRATDLLARYGGEEFVLLLPRTGGAEAGEIAERIGAVMRHRPLDLQLPEPAFVTLSIGVACTSAEVQRLSKLLQCADQALYEAKAAGRDRWQRYAVEINAVGSWPDAGHTEHAKQA